MAKKITIPTDKGLVTFRIAQSTNKVTVAGYKKLLTSLKPDSDGDGQPKILQNVIVTLSDGLITLSLLNKKGSININPTIEGNKLCITASAIGGQGSPAVYCEIIPQKNTKNPPD